MEFIRIANERFLSGDFDGALSLYMSAAGVYGERVVSGNIQLCRKRLLAKEHLERLPKSPLRVPELAPTLEHVLKSVLHIDRSYMINLSRRKDRFVRAMREMNAMGIRCCRIEGVDGRYSNEAKALLAEFLEGKSWAKRVSTAHLTDERLHAMKKSATVGIFGYLLSQKKVFEDAIRNGLKRILVLDDDVFFHSRAGELLLQVSQSLPADFKILLLGASEYADTRSERFSASFVAGSKHIYHPLPDLTCGSFAVVYDQSVFSDVLDAISEACGTFDNVALGYLYNKYSQKCFAVTPAVCIPDVGDSDIRHARREQESHSARMNWEYARYEDYAASYNVCLLVDNFKVLDYVSNMNSVVAPGINLSVFYSSPDGARPIILGHDFCPSDAVPNPLKCSSGEELKAFLDKAFLPRSDIVILWPEQVEITRDSVVGHLSDILEKINSERVAHGANMGFVYCNPVHTLFKKGRHSVIIPCFRSAAEVLPSVQSALLQDAPDFEVIIVHDNPSDENFVVEVKNKLDDWARGYPERTASLARLSIVCHSRNRNASAARNTGLFRSTGEWISFLDDDDYYEPDRLSAIEPVLRSLGSEFGACYCGYTGAWNGAVDMARFQDGDLGESVLLLKYAEHYMCTNTVTFTRDALMQVGGFDESYRRHQDLELMVRFFDRFKIRAVNRFLVKNRPAPVSSTFAASFDSLTRLKLKFLRDVRSRVKLKGDEFVASVVEAHVNDIFKGNKQVIPETRRLVEVALKQAVA